MGSLMPAAADACSGGVEAGQGRLSRVRNEGKRAESSKVWSEARRHPLACTAGLLACRRPSRWGLRASAAGGLSSPQQWPPGTGGRRQGPGQLWPACMWGGGGGAVVWRVGGHQMQSWWVRSYGSTRKCLQACLHRCPRPPPPPAQHHPTRAAPCTLTWAMASAGASQPQVSTASARASAVAMAKLEAAQLWPQVAAS